MTELPTVETDLPQPEGEALLTFGVNLPGAKLTGTKAMAETPEDITLRLAVFGSTGFLKEYVEAETVEGKYPDTDGVYHFKVRLSLSEQTRNIHLIANGPTTLPFLSEDEVLAGIYSEGDQDMYWQRISVDNGIVAQKVWDDEQSTWIYQRESDGVTYKLEESVKEKFRNINLIRNFASINVTSSAENFVLDTEKAFIIMNKPDRGSVAPYNTRTGEFLTDYYTKSYQEIKDSYDGYMPVGTTVGKDNSTDVNDFLPASAGGYLYERPKPTSSLEPTYILVHGTYYADDDVETKANGIECYYKINLMDSEGYYTIYRNFHYRIIISKVGQPGSLTAGDANNTGGTGDITINTEAQDLTDVSDGSGRMYVTYTSIALPEQKTGVELKYKFIPNTEDGTVDNAAVDIVIKDPNAYGAVFAGNSSYTVGSDQTLIGSDATGYVLVDNTDDAEQWRTIRYNTTATDIDAIKSQTISIIGRSYQNTLVSRDVEVILLERQKLTVTCRNKYVERDASTAKIPVDISIPKNLPEAMFPLVFEIESDQGTLTPDLNAVDENGNSVDNNLPVSSGQSIVPNSTAVNFQFLRTLTYDEYLSISSGSGDKATFTSYFVPNKDESACNVYATNKEYFNTDSDWFGNYYMFSNLLFDEWNANVNGTPIEFTFETEAGARPSQIVVTLEGLEPADGSGLTQIGNSDQYYYIPGNTDSHSLDLVYTGSGSIYSVTLSTIEGDQYMYKPATRTSEDMVLAPEITQRTTTIEASENLASGSYTFTDGDVNITIRFGSATFEDSWSGTYLTVNNNSTLSISAETAINATNVEMYSIDEVTLNYAGLFINYNANLYINGGTTNINNANNSYSTWTNNGSETSTNINFTLSRRNENRAIRVTNIEITYSVLEYTWQIIDQN